MKIYKKKFYVSEVIPGLSGFQQWDKREYFLVMGTSKNSANIVREFVSEDAHVFRLENGRLPEYQPIVTEIEAMAWLQENPFSRALMMKK